MCNLLHIYTFYIAIEYAFYITAMYEKWLLEVLQTCYSHK